MRVLVRIAVIVAILLALLYLGLWYSTGEQGFLLIPAARRLNRRSVRLAGAFDRFAPRRLGDDLLARWFALSGEDRARGNPYAGGGN
ncbi:hypothetical protein [Mesorhizobium sp. M2E.F.Ca.ET.219.01.1.1]|uniref:hypothetical protein n=1 Tax=Mesorhizobium sp. M2E.F.Ca.ET.219.01.1.1 TaxID=2500530 RepID=UPI000FDB1F4F|nr:hypothetical protein [Mesorhizobium sp. M2E.F.Ca.ET.219.01.1.1]TGQ06744.1 hypothetical protein EN862_027175 [Mesorhizobium sp. M2E.F.Ca.ET.219.01.1.1]